MRCYPNILRYCPCILRYCSNTLRYRSSISSIVSIFWVPFQCWRYRPSISGTVPGIEVLSLHFLEKLKKISKFSVWIDGLWATIWTRDLSDASRESYELKHYVRYDMYHLSIKVLSINCRDMSVVVTYTLSWALMYMVAVTAAKWRQSGMFILSTLQSDTNMGGRKCFCILMHYTIDSVGVLRRKRQTIMIANTPGGTWTWNPSEKQTKR